MGVSGDLKKDMGVAQKKVKGGVQMEVRKLGSVFRGENLYLCSVFWGENPFFQ
jgi:hypothetical protein